MWQFIANIILRNKFLILGIITLLTVFFGYNAATGLQLDNKYGILLPKNAQAKIDYDHFKEMFGEDGGILIIAIESDSLYTEENFRKWKELGDSLLQYEGVLGVVSEATLFTITNNEKDKKFEAHRIFSDQTFKEKSIDSIKREVKNNPLYRGLLFNEEDNVSLMMVTIDENVITDREKADNIIELEKVAKSYSTYFGKPRFAGLPHIRVVIGKQVMKEMYVFVALLILVTSILTYLFFQSLRVVLTCNLIVLVAVIWSTGSIAAFNFEITVIMALIPPLMIVIGIPNCIYLFTKYHQEVKDHGNKALALIRVIKKIGTATFMTNLTTAIGFLTFVTTNSPKLMEFGVVASLNIIIIFFLVICILPIIISLSKTPKQRHLKHLERKLAVGLLDSLIRITVNKRPLIYMVTILIVILSLLGISRIKATGNLTGDLPEGHQIKEDFNFIENHFGGSVPFEILISYKEPSRLVKKSTLEAIQEIQNKYDKDTLFTKHISFIDVLKAANMAYHNNDSTQYRLVTDKKQLKKIKQYIDSSLITNTRGVGVSLSELMDTTRHVLRIRAQMKDLGSYEISEKADNMRHEIDQILNPDRKKIEAYHSKYLKTGKISYVDSILQNYNGIANRLAESYIKNEDDRFAYDSDPYVFLKKKYPEKSFKANLNKAVEGEFFDITLTGTSILASEGTKFMVINLLTSLLFAIVLISILMAILFRSWRMVLISLVPNFVPLLFTAGVMGWMGIPLKPSTLLVFSIAFGISVDDTIHYLAKYRAELKVRKWDIKQCSIIAIRESGLGMFYTSIILFSGFIMFSFSQFGGTQALGVLISLTLLMAMITNLVLLPSLLLSLEKIITTKSFSEPYFDAYAEGGTIDWENLDIEEPLNPENKSEDGMAKEV